MAVAELERPAVLAPEDLRLLKIREERIRLMREHRAVRWVPNGAQEQFIDLCGSYPLGSGKTITYLLSGGNGIGKTGLLGAICKNLVAGPQNSWFERPLFQQFPAACSIRITSTEAALKEGLLRELSELFVVDLLPGYPKAGGCDWMHLWRVRGRHGSVCTVKVYTWQQSITQHAGARVDAVLLDEPGPEAIYDEDAARLRGGGPIIWGMTPVDAKGGISKDVAWIFEQAMRAEDASRPSAWRVRYADMEDNCVEHGVRGRVPHAVIEDKMLQYADRPAVMQARVYGRHALELGRVLPEWDDKRHVCGDLQLLAGYPRYAALDVHEGKPQVFNYYVLTPFHELILWREAVVEAGRFQELIDAIKEIYRRWGWPKVALIDPRAMVQNPVTGISMYDSLVEAELTFRSAGQEKSDKDKGIGDFRARLAGVDGRPLFRAHESCTFSISQFKRWMVDPRTLKPEKKNDDAPENTYRVVLALPPYPTDATRKAEREGAGWRSSLVVP